MLTLCERSNYGCTGIQPYGEWQRKMPNFGRGHGPWPCAMAMRLWPAMWLNDICADSIAVGRCPVECGVRAMFFTIALRSSHTAQHTRHAPKWFCVTVGTISQQDASSKYHGYTCSLVTY